MRLPGIHARPNEGARGLSPEPPVRLLAFKVEVQGARRRRDRDALGRAVVRDGVAAASPLARLHVAALLQAPTGRR